MILKYVQIEISPDGTPHLKPVVPFAPVEKNVHLFSHVFFFFSSGWLSSIMNIDNL